MAPRAMTPPPVITAEKLLDPPPPVKGNEKPPEPKVKVTTTPPPAPKAAVLKPSAVPPPTPALPPAAPPLVPQSPFLNLGTPIRKLGFRVDSWYELLPGEGSRSDELAGIFKEEVEGAAGKDVRVVDSLLNGGGIATRTYQLVHNGTGATVAARFATVGKDLYAGWELFIRREINWLPIFIIGGIALVLAVVDGILSGIATNFFYAILSLFQVFLGLLLVPGLGLLLFGKLFKDDIWGFFFKDQDAFALDDANALSLLVDDALSRAIDRVIIAPAAKKK